METLDWNDSLAVGFKEVDDDHKKLIGMLNSLITAINENHARDAIGKVLNELVGYTSWHFRHEERLMQTHRYTGFTAHKGEHGKLTEQAVELQRKFHDEGVDLTQEIMEFLKGWLTDHILRSDLEMSAFLSNKIKS